MDLTTLDNQKIEQMRAVTEVQAGMVIAKKFPRNEVQAMQNIMSACRRHRFAQQALYSYPRGNQVVSGSSIRMAEALAQYWGNIDFGIKIIEQRADESECISYCWDIQNNVKSTRGFTVKHQRDTKKGPIKLTVGRDIYEAVMSQGARRLRACILALIPQDIQEEAEQACEITMREAIKENTVKVSITRMIDAFGKLEKPVTREMIESKAGKSLEEFNSNDIVGYQKIYASLRDKISGLETWGFAKTKEVVNEELNQKLQ